ncbi:MAG: hypothetical protein AMJ70_03935 [Dehalococcoidia bacterium SG8_51_3]|nr:MAG: hypothetical protein AMJ70_03935 [Dehalococcoidia bacterium SG8_51_3]
MSLSFANLILTPSILSGVTNTLNEQQVDTLFAHIVIDPKDEDHYLSNIDQTIKKIEQVHGVVGASAHLNSTAFMEYQWQDKNAPSDRGKSGSWTIIGINPIKEANVTTINENIIEGSYLDENDRDEIVLGVEIAGGDKAQTSPFLTLEGVRVGDDLRLTYPNGIQKEYRVKGIFQAHEMGKADRLAFVTKKEMASVMGRSIYADRASQILVRIEQTGDETIFIKKLEALGIDGEIRSWDEYGGAVGSIVSSFNVVASLISGIGLVVAAVVMFIVIYINVINRKRQIGILRAIGIKRSVIIFSYIIQTLFYAAIGVILGGLLFGHGIMPYFEHNPINLPIGVVSLAIKPVVIYSAVFGLILAAVFAGFIPVISIIKQSIIKAIWGN